jgi:putative membrane protein
MTSQSLLRSLAYTLLLAACFSFTACGPSNNRVDQTVTEITPETPSTTAQDARFMSTAADINFGEIMLAKLAQQRSISEEIKSIAKMCEETHRAANAELRALAMNKGIRVPTAASAKVMADYDQLNLYPTKEFDNGYIGMIVTSHQNAISTFEKYINGPCDPEVKNWATGKVPELRSHLAKAIEIQGGVSDAVSAVYLENNNDLAAR